MKKEDELILVVPAEIIFQKSRWQGLKRDDLDYHISLIKHNYQFKRRGDVEEDPAWQQIIPYVIFNYLNKFFIYKYLPNAGEQRLVDNYQLGIGGHINKIDAENLSPNFNGRRDYGIDILEAGMMREWKEEVYYKGNILEKKLVGLLNDDSRPVEAVHLGLVYNFAGDSPEISIKEKDKMQGELVNLRDVAEYIKGEGNIWAQLVYRDYLKNLI